MDDADEWAAEFAAVAGIAAAIRAELGAEIDHEYPGLRDPAEAGQVNRAFRAAARHVLGAFAPPGDDLPALVTRALAEVARRRLAADGLDAAAIDALLALEPAGRDDWVAFLILTTPQRVRDQLDAVAPGPG